VDTPRPSPRTNRTRCIPHPVLIGHAASSQAQASHLRQQLDGAGRDREALRAQCDAAVADARAGRARAEELEAGLAAAEAAAARQAEEAQRKYDALAARLADLDSIGQPKAAARGRADNGAAADAAAGEGGLSAVAQRTRGRGGAAELLAEGGEAEEEAESGAAARGAEEAEAEAAAEAAVQSVVAKRTRGRIAEQRGQREERAERQCVLRHLPVAGEAPQVAIPAVVPLSHTGFVIGRHGESPRCPAPSCSPHCASPCC
jgi:hypothetical protein